MPCASRTCEAPQPQGFAHAGADRRLSRWLVSVGSGEHRHFQSRASDGSFKLFVPVRPHAAPEQAFGGLTAMRGRVSVWAAARPSGRVHRVCISVPSVGPGQLTVHKVHTDPDKIRRYEDTKIQKEGRRRPLANATTNPIMKRIARGKKALAHPSPLYLHFPLLLPQIDG